MNFLSLRKLLPYTLFSFSLCFLLTPSSSSAAEIVWEVYDPSNLAKGYKVYYRLSTEQFESSIDVGNILSYKIEDLNIPFQPEETYYFAVSVYTDSAESPLSDEVSYTHQSLTTEDIDSDGDGLKDDEETTLYYTDPYNSDTDGDNISDGDEVANDTDPLTPQPTVTLLTPGNGATIPIGETILSCQAKSPNCDISHISLYSDISGTFQLDSTYYAGEIHPTEDGLTSLFHFNNSTIDSISQEYALPQDIEFSTTSQFGQSANFFGYNNSITPSDQDGRFDFTDELTIEAWVYPTSITPWDYIASKAWNTHTYPYINYALGFYNDTNTLRFAISVGGSQHMVTTDTINTFQWYHVVGTYSSTKGELKIYLNGQLADSTQISGSLDATTTPLLAGAYQYEPEESWNGLIDELALYRKALSLEEIEAHYAANVRSVIAEFPVPIENDGLYNWNCQAYDVNDSSSMAPTEFSLTTSDSEVATIIFEDAEDGSTSRWSLEEENTTNTITNTTSPDRPGKVIAFSGSPSVANQLNTFSLTDTGEFNSFNLGWSHTFQDYFVIKINISTSQGDKTLFYWPGDMTFIAGAGNAIFIGLGSESANGEWQSFTRNIHDDVRQIESINDIFSLNQFTLYGNGQIDDIKIDISSSPPAT